MFQSRFHARDSMLDASGLRVIPLHKNSLERYRLHFRQADEPGIEPEPPRKARALPSLYLQLRDPGSAMVLSERSNA